MDRSEQIRLLIGALTILVCLIIGGLIGLVSHNTFFPVTIPACTSCPTYRCDYAREPVSVQIIGQTSASGKGSIIGIDPSILVEAQNPIDTRPVRATARITCKTLTRPSEIFSSEPIYLKPLEKYTFSFTYDISSNEDWSCTDFTVTADEISGCRLQENQ